MPSRCGYNGEGGLTLCKHVLRCCSSLLPGEKSSAHSTLSGLFRCSHMPGLTTYSGCSSGVSHRYSQRSSTLISIHAHTTSCSCKTSQALCKSSAYVTASSYLSHWPTFSTGLVSDSASHCHRNLRAKRRGHYTPPICDDSVRCKSLRIS